MWLKVRAMSADLRLGRGKREGMTDMLTQALNGGTCPYCGVLLNLKNVSVDHKIPIRKDRTKVPDSWDNLHMVCRKCNRMKADIPHDAFLRLLAFLDADPEPELGRVLRKRLSQAAVMWGKRKKTG